MAERGRTGSVSKLVLLALYPVLERLRVAAGDLDLLLDRFLVHIGHTTRAWLDGRTGSREARGGEAARQEEIQGASQGAQQADGRNTGRSSDGAAGRSSAMAMQTRTATAIACAEGVAAGDGRGRAWVKNSVAAECWRWASEVQERAGVELGLAEKPAGLETVKGPAVCTVTPRAGEASVRSLGGRARDSDSNHNNQPVSTHLRV